jgi:SSS family solute:Na+ symporter
MNMHWIDWTIVGGLIFFITSVAIYTKRYTKGVADFLAAGRSARRYLLCVAGGMAGLGAITIVGRFESFYQAGFTAMWWGMLLVPVAVFIALSGWVIYRFRETRALTMAQFFEVRYSGKFRVFAGIVAWTSGIVNFGIFPAVGARFFIYFCGLPPEFSVLGVPVQTFATLMFLLLAISLFFVFLGGQIAVIVTDFIQGMFCNIAFLIILIFFIFKFEWGEIISTLIQAAPADKSMIHPFQTSKIESFNIFFYILSALTIIYGTRAWQGAQGYNSSAKNAHEARMGGILGEWRAMILLLLLMLLPICAYVVLNNPGFTGVAADVNNILGGIENKAVRTQMIVPVTLAKVLPIGLVGVFAAVMLAAFISTHDTYLHSWGSIFIQDVILPFRKKPFSTKEHIWLLRFSILFVAVFIFMFSLLFQQNDYILMFFSATGAIFIGGAGACIVGGLYWKRGTTLGAWVALATGAIVASSGIALQQTWKDSLYPWLLANTPGFLAGMKYVLEGISYNVKWINWKVGPEKFPLHGQWINFLAIILSITGYIVCSLIEGFVKKSKGFDLDHLLHRGKYAIKGEHEHHVAKPATGLRALIPSKEFSFGDKIIFYAQMTWTLGWFVIFVVGTAINLRWDVPAESWATFWGWKIGITIVLGIGTTIWFIFGGLSDLKYMFNILRTAQRNDLDMGMVIDHHNLGENEKNGKIATNEKTSPGSKPAEFNNNE